MMQVGTNQSAAYHSQPALSTSGGQTGRSSSSTRQPPNPAQYDAEQMSNIRPRLCVLRKWPHYDGYGLHLARNQHWLGLRIGDVEPNSPAESGGLLREDVVLAVNGHSVENDDFFVILSLIQHELEGDSIRFLVLDPHTADLARRNNLSIDENYRSCVRMETPTLTVSPEKLLYDQWRATNAADPTAAQNTINLGPTLPANQSQPHPYPPQQDRPPHDGLEDVYTFPPYSDANSELGPGARMCSVTLRPGIDSIGISLQPDKDFGHIIQRVEPDSPADYAGIQRNDCIISLNDIPLLNAPYQDVLSTLKRYRSEPNLDFLVAQKSYLLRSNQSNSAGEVLPSSNITEKSAASTVPPGKALEQLFNKYNNDENASFDDVTGRKRPGETVSTSNANDRYDRLSPQLDNNRYPSKSQQGQIMQGVGPATADRSSWGGSGGKSGDESQLPASGDSSIRSASGDRGRNSNDANDRSGALGDSFKPLQVGITNPGASQQPGGATPNFNDDHQGGSRPGFGDDRQDGSRAGSSNDQRDSASKVSPGSSIGAANNAGDARNNGTLQNLQTAVPITPAKTDYDRGSTQGSSSAPSDARLGPTKPTPAPSKPPTAPSAGYTDTDDEDLSDISEKPDEEDVSDPVSVSTGHPTGVNALGKAAGSLYPSNAASDPANRNANASKDLNDRDAANAGKQIAGAPSSTRTVVQARRLERSDSDDTMSESDRSSLPSLPQAGTTTQPRRLEKTDSDDFRPAPAKPSNVQTILQARRLEQADSDEIQSSNRPTVQARRLEQVDSDDIQPASSKPSTVQTILQARRLEQVESDEIQSGNRPTVQARRLDKADSDENLSAAESQTTKRSGADSFYSPLDSADEGTDTDERALNDIDDAANQKLNELLAKSTSHQQQLRPRDADDAEERESDEESTEESSSDEGSTESQRTPEVRERTMLARLPLAELRHHGYELHDIQLMQPTETSPVGLKLTKQQDPLQYVITAVAKDTKADLAGLKVDDWLVKIEERDVRLVDFSEVSHEIRQLLTNAGLINMVIARKRSASPSPIPTRGGQQRAPAPSSSSRADSIGRQQAAQPAKSLLTTDITRDTPDNTQVRFTPEQSQAASTMRSQRSPPSVREGLAQVPLAPLSVGITNPISDDNATKSPASRSRSPSHSPTREFTVSRQEKASISDQLSDSFNPRDIREIVLQEASGLDFNSFIPEGDSQIQTHFISNVQPTSTAGKAGLRDGDRILTVNGVDVRNAVHEDVRLMMQNKKPLRLTVVNDPKYVELIENVKRNQPNAEERASPPRASARPDSGATAAAPRATSSSPKPAKDDLWKYLVDLFRDDKGIVQVKHCVLKKDPSYNGYGLLLRYQNGLHLIDQVEPGSPAYNAGLREDDVILFVDQKNVEQMTHDDVKILIRKLALSNVDIDLVLIRKGDVQRYKAYQEKKTIDWKHVLESKAVGATEQTDQQPLGSTQSIDDPISISRPAPRHSSASDKAPAPAPPTSLAANTRVCILHPSPARTAGFALSGKSPPPFVICQIEKDSPADQAGLTVNDTLLAINGKSVTETTYEETVKLIKEALQQKSVELTVRDQARAKTNSQSSATEQRNTSMASGGSSISGANGGQDGAELHMRADNPVQEYQKQRNKELSYTLRLCHLHAANGDGTQAATFGFELSEEPDYEYPLILRVEAHSPAEGAGLQSRDILLKINEKKTKGLGYDKVKKEIEKAKRDGRLEMLVVDQETYDYCKRTKKPLKEPDMKVKHVFPKSRSSASFHKLPIANAMLSSRDSSEQLPLSTTRSDESASAQPSMPATFGLPISEQTDSENDDEPQSIVAKDAPRASAPTAPVNFDLAPPRTPTIAVTRAHDSPLKFFDPAQNPPAQHASTSSLASQNALPTARSTSSLSQRPSKDSKTSKAKALPNAINSLLHRMGHSKSSKPEYDAPTRMTTSSKGRAPSPPTSRAGYSRSDNPYVSQSIDTVTSNSTILPASTIQDTVRSTVSTGSFDYLRGPRRCVLRVDRNKGLGFVLSATGDYDHTITTVEEDSAAAIAGLQVNDEVLEVDGVDVRNVKYEQVVDMIVSSIRTKDTIEMRVVDGRARDVYPSTAEGERQIHTINVLNSNNNNNTVATSTHQSQRSTAVLGDDLSEINSSVSPFDSYNQQKIATSYPNLPGQLKHIDRFTSRALSGSVPALATGITASPGIIHHAKSISTSSEKGSITKLSDISSQDAPVARLCRVRKFATSPFYGFFLCGDPKKLGRVFISDVTKHSPAAVCGLRDGDRIIEINGTPTHSLTYETILDKIKQHMARDDLELLVLDKKSVHWYRERNYPITSRTLPTIVHIEPIINDPSAEMQSSDVPSTHTKMVGFADRRVSKTGL